MVEVNHVDAVEPTLLLKRYMPANVTWPRLLTRCTLLTQEYPAMLGLHNFYPPKEGEKAVEH